MPTVERPRDQGSRRGKKVLAELAEEFRDTRLAVGLSQRQVANAVGTSRPTITRVESGEMPNLSILTASEIAAVLGLNLVVKCYPGGEPLRDAAQRGRLEKVLGHVSAPLGYQTETSLPQAPDRPYEQRAWDALISGAGKRTAVEVEMRIRDAQALERRLDLKRRDDPVDNLVLIVADTEINRRVLREHPGLFPGLARLTFRGMTRFLDAGLHPPSCLVLL